MTIRSFNIKSCPWLRSQLIHLFVYQSNWKAETRYFRFFQYLHGHLICCRFLWLYEKCVSTLTRPLRLLIKGKGRLESFNAVLFTTRPIVKDNNETDTSMSKNSKLLIKSDGFSSFFPEFVFFGTSALVFLNRLLPDLISILVEHQQIVYYLYFILEQ